jgi:hypothetical protein
VKKETTFKNKKCFNRCKIKIRAHDALFQINIRGKDRQAARRRKWKELKIQPQKSKKKEFPEKMFIGRILGCDFHPHQRHALCEFVAFLSGSR